MLSHCPHLAMMRIVWGVHKTLLTMSVVWLKPFLARLGRNEDETVKVLKCGQHCVWTVEVQSLSVCVIDRGRDFH